MAPHKNNEKRRLDFATVYWFQDQDGLLLNEDLIERGRDLSKPSERNALEDKLDVNNVLLPREISRKNWNETATGAKHERSTHHTRIWARKLDYCSDV